MERAYRICEETDARHGGLHLLRVGPGPQVRQLTRAAPRYRADLARDAVVEPIDGLFLLYHRPSGETHVIAGEMLAMLRALDGAPGDADEVFERLRAEFDLEAEAGDAAAIVAGRIAELAALGLIDPAP